MTVLKPTIEPGPKPISSVCQIERRLRLIEPLLVTATRLYAVFPNREPVLTSRELRSQSTMPYLAIRGNGGTTHLIFAARNSPSANTRNGRQKVLKVL